MFYYFIWHNNGSFNNLNKPKFISYTELILFPVKNEIMKKIVVCFALSFVLFACADSADEKGKANEVDTSVIGSDNPNPLPPDTTGTGSNTDSIKN